VIIRTSGGGKLPLPSRSVVAFEADEIDIAIRSGWSVVVLGNACLVRDIDQLAAFIGRNSRPWVARAATTSSASKTKGSAADALFPYVTDTARSL
jgi:hypothetical protein